MEKWWWWGGAEKHAGTKLTFKPSDSDKIPGREEKEGGAKDEMKAGGGAAAAAAAMAPQSKGKKNAYSNSVQKMTCPYCPRVFPWASSLQRHMLTHTGDARARRLMRLGAGVTRVTWLGGVDVSGLASLPLLCRSEAVSLSQV